MKMLHRRPSGLRFPTLLLLCAWLPAAAAADAGALSPLALAHQEKALALLGQAGASGDSRGMQHALLHALAAQTLSPPEDAGLAPADLGAFLAEPPTAAFALRWRSPSAWLGGSVPALVWSQDGTWLATAGGDGRVRLWDPASGAQRAALTVNGGRADALAVDATGTRLAAGGADGGIQLWALAADGGTPRPLGQWAAHTGMVRTLAFSPDGRRLASGGQDGLLKLWDPAGGTETAALAPGRGWVESLAFSPDGRLLVAGAIQGGVQVWTLDEDGAPAPRTVLDSGRGAVRGVTVSPDGRWLGAGTDDGRVHLWALPEGLDGSPAPATRLLGKPGAKLLALAFDATGERLATGDMDGRLRLWDLTAERPEPVTLETTGGRVLDLGFAPRGGRLAATTLHGLRLWELSGSDAPRPLLADQGHGERVLAVAASPDGRLIASGDGDGGLLLWDAASGQELKRLPAGEAAIEALAFAGDGKRLASGDGDGTVRVWNLSAGAEAASLHTTLAGSGRVAALAFAEADSRLVIASGNGAARALDLADGTTRTLAPYASEVEAVAMDRGGRLLALGIKDAVLGLVDLVEAQADAPPRPALPSLGGRIKALALSDDGGLLAAAMQDGYVRLLDAASGAERARLIGAGDKLASLVFTADGSRLIGGRNDGGVVVWDVASGREIARLEDFSGRVYALAQGADPDTLVSGAGDGSVRLWTLPLTDPEPRAATPDPWRHDGWTWAVALDGTGGLLASAGADGRLVVDRPNGPGEPLRLTGHTGVVPGLVMNRAGTWLASAGTDGSVRLWDPADGHALALLGDFGLPTGGGGGSGLAERITGTPGSGGASPLAERARAPAVSERWSLALSPAETLLAVGGEDGGIQLWDLAGGAADARLLESLRDDRGRILALAFSGDGALLAAGAEDGSIRLWETASRAPLVWLPGGGGRVLDLAYDPDPDPARGLLAAASQDGRVRIWAPASSTPAATLEPGGGLVRVLGISPDGRLLATGSEDGRVRLWDLAGGSAAAALLASIDTGAGQVVSLAFSGDGRRLAAGTTDGRARTFDLRPISLLANGPAPSARAARIAAALQRLWRLAPDGIGFIDEAWPRLIPHADAAAQRPDGRDLAPLLAPPPAGDDKLSQLLDWLAAQGQEGGGR